MAMKKKAVKKTTKKSAKKKAAPKKAKREYHHKHEGMVVTEAYLTRELSDDLRDAWLKLRAFGASLAPERIYASHNCIMFSRKTCFFFVRPKKKWLEVWFFAGRAVPGLKSMRGAKTIEKYSNFFKLEHADQVEEPLTDWLREAYAFTPGTNTP
jgi:hypothetical protein